MKPISNIADDFVFLSMCRSFRTTYDVNSLPKLIVVKDTGEIITKTGRKEVQDRGFIGYRNWREAANLKEGGKLHSSAIIKSDRTLDPKDSDAWGTLASTDFDINNAGVMLNSSLLSVLCYILVPVHARSSLFGYSVVKWCKVTDFRLIFSYRANSCLRAKFRVYIVIDYTCVRKVICTFLKY